MKRVSYERVLRLKIVLSISAFDQNIQTPIRDNEVAECLTTTPHKGRIIAIPAFIYVRGRLKVDYYRTGVS